MESRWSDSGAREAIARWGGEHGEVLALRLYTARLIGAEATLVLHGGGNVSIKGTRRTLLGDEVEALYIKGSGGDLATLEPAGLPGVDLAYLRRFRALEALTDDDMVNEIRTHLFDASAPTPSIETLLHAFLPQRFVDHSHADVVLALTNQPDGARLVREVLGRRVAIVPYVRPGFELAKAVASACECDPRVEGIVLLFHGLVTFGDDARTSYARHIALVDACEQFIEQRTQAKALTPAGAWHGSRLRDHASSDESSQEIAARIAPLLRGLLAHPTGNEDQPHRRMILEWRGDEQSLAWVNSVEARTLARSGPLTSDHLIRTKALPMFVENPIWNDGDALRKQMQEVVEAYRRDYANYTADHGGSMEGLDTAPRVVLLPGAGVFCWGPTKRDARIAADITEHTLIAKMQAHWLGAYRALPAEHWYEMEYRGLQRAKLETMRPRPLEGQVVVISGGAGAIGSAIAEVCAETGAHVALADLDAARLTPIVSGLRDRHGDGVALGVVMDVTDESNVQGGYDEIVRFFGGVDVIVPNAGIAHVSPIETLFPSDFRRVMEINATGYLLFMQAGIRVLKEQGLGGHIIINASKNVFGPGKDFGAYSASKAAGHQLGKVAAIELAPLGIRVNMINADAVFGNEAHPSGLWQEVGPQRAKSRGIDPTELQEYYRSRNLLGAYVRGRHVGNAVVFFASNSTPTTGATLPVDGGVVEAFPR